MKKIIDLISWKKMLPLLLLFIISFLLFVYSLFYNLSMSWKLSDAESRLVQAKLKFVGAVERAERLDGYLLTLDELARKGYVAEPDKLQWLQALELVVDEYKIPQVKFTLMPTSDSDNSNLGENISLGHTSLLETPMLIEMDLMHEGDFYLFLTEYRKKALGVFRVESCELNRIDQRTTDTIYQFRSTCRLTWLNYPDPRKQWQETS